MIRWPFVKNLLIGEGLTLRSEPPPLIAGERSHRNSEQEPTACREQQTSLPSSHQDVEDTHRNPKWDACA
jgi:hypothetical protein